MKQKSSPGQILLMAAILIGGMILATIWLSHKGDIGQQLGSQIIGGVGAFATASLAIATYTTVLQNRRTVEELQKDREKPLAEDKLRLLVVPFITKLDSKIQKMKDGLTEWVEIRDSYGNPWGETPYERLLSSDLSNTVRRELESDNPELLRQIETHDDAAREMEQTVDEILTQLEARIQEFVEVRSLENDDGERVDEELISKHVQAEHEDVWYPRNHETLWNTHGDDLMEIKDEQITNKINGAEAHYLERCRTLRSELIDYKVKLQQRYGISEQDIQELDTNEFR